ncbi:MAG: endonuclease/exonuclease/phosphatase family protein [Firmicutes bacterium]|nr:endonuclease/exonuclease/phosphatase family protein [Bacillota bacterium]
MRNGFLRAMTYNLHGGRDPLNRPSLDGIAATITAAEADLIGLQEVERRFRDRTDGAALLAAAVGRELRFAPALDRMPGEPGGEFGLAVLSRWPILRSSFILLPSRGEPRILLSALVEGPWGPLRFLTCHLGLDAEERRGQVEAIVRFVEGFRGPAVLAGDFNAPAEAAELGPLFTRWQEVQTACGLNEATFPAAAARIDFIFCPRSWRVLCAAVLPSPASDHRPVVADLVPA